MRLFRRRLKLQIFTEEEARARCDRYLRYDFMRRGWILVMCNMEIAFIPLDQHVRGMKHRDCIDLQVDDYP